MDCGTISNLFVRFACVMNGTPMDEYFGFDTLVFIGVGGMAALMHTLITHWNGPPSKKPARSEWLWPINIVVFIGGFMLVIYGLGIGAFALGLLIGGA